LKERKKEILRMAAVRRPCVGSVPENDLDEAGFASAEDEEVAGERILLQHLLNQQSQWIAKTRRQRRLT